jgi:hypothetical protein
MNGRHEKPGIDKIGRRFLATRPDILNHRPRAFAAGLAFVLLLCGCASDQVPTSDRKDTVISHHVLRGKLIGFEIGDYVHPVVRDGAGKKRSFFVNAHGLDYYLALHAGEMLELEYELVDSFFEEAGGVVRIERLVTATDGRLGAQEWWQMQRREHSLEQLHAQYELLIDQYTISRYATETPFALTTLRGTWRITDTHFCPHVCAMDETEAARLTGAILSYSAGGFSNGRVSCSSPRFSRRGWTREEFFGEYRFKSETLGLKRPVIEELSVQCSDARVSWPVFGATVLVRDDRTILVAWDGFFFEARRK